MQYTFETEGVCSTRIEIELDGNIVKSVQFMDGCDGNLSAIARLVVGMTVEQVQEKLSGVTCDDRPTSCPDQLARALAEAYAIETDTQAADMDAQETGTDTHPAGLATEN